MKSPIRVLVVDDSAFVRKVLRELLTEQAEIEVVGIARDGLEALEKIAALDPDVVTLDIVMPHLDGLGVLQNLKQLAPDVAPRVVVVSTSDAESELALRALELGAVDVLTKPTALATDRLYAMRDELIAKVRAAAIARPAALPVAPPTLAHPPVATHRQLIVVGASTGGPQAITQLVRSLPADFPVPVAIALHIPPGYTPALASRLDEHSALEVREASAGLALTPGRVVIAPGGLHLTIQRRTGQLTCQLGRSPSTARHFPSVDVLFSSAAAQVGAACVGIVLTGMGDDGLEGSRRIKERGGSVLTESAASCIVYGMPRVVDEAKLSDATASVAELGALLLQTL